MFVGIIYIFNIKIKITINLFNHYKYNIKPPKLNILCMIKVTCYLKEKRNLPVKYLSYIDFYIINYLINR